MACKATMLISLNLLSNKGDERKEKVHVLLIHEACVKSLALESRKKKKKPRIPYRFSPLINDCNTQQTIVIVTYFCH